MEPITVTAFVTALLLPSIHPVSSEFIFQNTVPQHIGHGMFSDINILQGRPSVSTPLGCGGIFNDDFIVNRILSATVKEL